VHRSWNRELWCMRGHQETRLAKYQYNDAHDLKSPNCDPHKTLLPGDAEEIYSDAVTDDPTNPDTWYGKNADRHIHRYQGCMQGGELRYHVNGSTAMGTSLGDPPLNTPPPRPASPQALSVAAAESGCWSLARLAASPP
jgi:hypothetical protein